MRRPQRASRRLLDRSSRVRLRLKLVLILSFNLYYLLSIYFFLIPLFYIRILQHFPVQKLHIQFLT